MVEEKPKMAGWFSMIRNRDDAVNVAKDSATALFLVAGIQAGIGFLLAQSMLIDAAIFALCAFFIRRFFSRTAAVVALLMSLVAIVTTLMVGVAESVGGWSNVVVALVGIWAAFRSIEATFKLHGKYKEIVTVD